MAQSLGLLVFAGGVERWEQANRLQALGCQLAQGYLLGAPLHPRDLDPLPPTTWPHGAGPERRPPPEPSLPAPDGAARPSAGRLDVREVVRHGQATDEEQAGMGVADGTREPRLEGHLR